MTDTTTTAPTITGVDFVAIPTNDLEASMHFYGTVLGLPFVKRWGNMPGVEYQAGNLTLAIMDPTAFGPVIKRAKEAGVVLVAFDNILDTEDAINVNVDQKGLGELWGQWLVDHIPDGGKVLEVRGVAGTSVDTDRHNGIHEKLDASGHAITPPLLDANECDELAALFDTGRFRSTIDMARHRFGDGRYRYFDHPLPEPVAALVPAWLR